MSLSVSLRVFLSKSVCSYFSLHISLSIFKSISPPIAISRPSLNFSECLCSSIYLSQSQYIYAPLSLLFFLNYTKSFLTLPMQITVFVIFLTIEQFFMFSNFVSVIPFLPPFNSFMTLMTSFSSIEKSIVEMHYCQTFLWFICNCPPRFYA